MGLQLDYDWTGIMSLRQRHHRHRSAGLSKKASDRKVDEVKRGLRGFVPLFPGDLLARQMP